jgi:nondiscriminating aspartyl-tRNA synthetase
MVGHEVEVKGWLLRKRDLGGIRFIIVRDRDGIFQVTAAKKSSDAAVFQAMDSISLESVVEICGKVKAMKQAPGGVEVVPEGIREVSSSESPLPLDVTEKVKADVDTRLDNRAIDLRRLGTRALFRLRSQVLKYIRDFFDEEGFTEINTPKIIASASEGGTELFPIAYFEREAFLAQSPQLYKEEMIPVFEKVWEISPIFRAETHNTTRHLNESMSIDIECAFASCRDVMGVAERLLKRIVDRILANDGELTRLIGSKLKPVELPLPILTYEKAIEIAGKGGVKVEWGEDLGTLATRKIGQAMKTPYFIVDWPDSIKPFYIQPKDNGLADGFDMMWKHLELASGGQRVHEKSLLERRLEDRGLNPQDFNYHLQAFRYGMPPHSGWAIGVERLMMILTGKSNIREVCLFPRDRLRLVP